MSRPSGVLCTLSPETETRDGPCDCRVNMAVCFLAKGDRRPPHVRVKEVRYFVCVPFSFSCKTVVVIPIACQNPSDIHP